MNLQEFQKETIDTFRGLYKRGATDRTPQDHASEVSNLSFTNMGEAVTRPGSSQSLNFNHPVTRMFLATPKSGYSVFTYDGASTIYQYNPSTNTEIVAFNSPALKDFCGLNMGGKTYISIAVTPGSPAQLMVIDPTTNSLRYAAGYPPVYPSGGVPATTFGAGNCDPGLHKFAISYITNTGYMTRPGLINGSTLQFQPIEWISPGNASVQLTNIPTGPPNEGVVARQIFATKSEQDEYFYLGQINDNSTTSAVFSFFDTDLEISADDLFDQMDLIPAGVGSPGYATMGLYKYHGRMIVIGNTDAPSKILVSEAGDPEAFNTVHGYIQIPTEFDGNDVRGVCALRDVLYFTKPVGIFSTQDNYDNPSTWPVVQVDGSAGAFYFGIATITGAQTALSVNDVILMADRGGIYVFSGVIVQPPLTWKINDLWLNFTHQAQHMITLDIDPFDKLIYALIPVYGNLYADTLLVGDFTEGLTADLIKWSVYNFPFSLRSIALMNFQDATDFEYHLRLGTTNGVYKLDKSVGNDYSAPITVVFQTSLVRFGNLNVFRALTLRGNGSDVLLSLFAQDGQRIQTLNTLSIANLGIEYTRQINYVSEKMMVRVTSSSYLRLSRVDVYGKEVASTRPL